MKRGSLPFSRTEHVRTFETDRVERCSRGKNAMRLIFERVGNASGSRWIATVDLDAQSRRSSTSAGRAARFQCILITRGSLASRSRPFIKPGDSEICYAANCRPASSTSVTVNETRFHDEKNPLDPSSML